MKYIILLIMVFISASVNAQEEQPTDAVQVEEKSVLKGLLYKVWGKFKSMSPKNERKLARNGTVTAGIRGAETTSTILQPYWKNDKTSDEHYIQQLEMFSQAQSLVDKGELQAANRAFSGFVKQWPESDLKPNAQFAEALTVGGMGKIEKSRQLFRTFIEVNPQHPLIKEAKVVMAELR